MPHSLHNIKPTSGNDNPAADLIRQKLATLYKEEPDAASELADAESTPKPLSKHQRYMLKLHNSGQSLATIQTAWHEYYVSLPDHEKHEVWQEFYTSHAKSSQFMRKLNPATESSHLKPAPSIPVTHQSKPHTPRSAASVKKQLLGRVQNRGKLQAKHHVQSLLFGLGMGGVVVVIFLFGFFNERFIAPFITPSRAISNTPLIIDPNNNGPVGAEPKIIIPKINVEIPIVFDQPSIEEHAMQQSLERGVVHYATTSNPGQHGNGAIFGHSSNNILNKGKYKFAFVLLKRLENGDTFIVQKDSKRYVYRVFDKKVVKPSEVSILNDSLGKPATMSLITCDPPGTSLNRLVVVGEQITPDPTANVASTAVKPPETKPPILPGNSPSLWQRITGIFTS